MNVIYNTYIYFMSGSDDRGQLDSQVDLVKTSISFR